MNAQKKNGRKSIVQTRLRSQPHATVSKTHAVGIDLGTTYSCIACLNEHGEPVTLPNQEGETQTPSVVLFDTNEVIVGREALRHAIAQPHGVVQNSKRFMGDRHKRWTIHGKSYTAIDVAAFVLRKLLAVAEERLGRIERAVITVPTQSSDMQRDATVEAGLRAGLKRVDILNEPVAASLCAVLGTEGLWFMELADEQCVLVFDLGGGTFDLSLVKYSKNEVRVLASGGDLYLGGIDWNSALLETLCDQFQHDFGQDPRTDAESLQFLALEVEEVKRSLSVRERAPMTAQHAGHRKIYELRRGKFEKLTRPLVARAAEITRGLLSENDVGWADVNIVMMVGGATRMPMIRNMLKQISGRTLNTSMSPDQSIAHGAAYYAGMLLSNVDLAQSTLNRKTTERLSKVRQHSRNARALGILVRDTQTGRRVPHYLIRPNTTLPVSVKQTFGTVVANQKRVHLHVVESGVRPQQPFAELGACNIDDLPPGLPEGSSIEVTFHYDEQARVHVEAKELAGSHVAKTEIIRPENVVTPPPTEVVEARPLDEPGAPLKPLPFDKIPRPPVALPKPPNIP